MIRYTKREQITIAFQILLDCVGQKHNITYGKMAPQIGTNAQNVARYLDPIAAYLINQGLPILPVLVVRADTDRPGDGYYRWRPRGTIDAEREKVINHDWNALPDTVIDDLLQFNRIP